MHDLEFLNETMSVYTINSKNKNELEYWTVSEAYANDWTASLGFLRHDEKFQS